MYNWKFSVFLSNSFLLQQNDDVVAPHFNNTSLKLIWPEGHQEPHNEVEGRVEHKSIDLDQVSCNSESNTLIYYVTFVFKISFWTPVYNPNILLDPSF